MKSIVHPQQLAEELSSGVYWNFEPIDLRILTKEAYHGSMTKEEFREFAIQYFAKYSSKIWKGKDVYTGNWKNALNEMYRSWFLALGKTAFNKHIIVEMIQEYTWRINNARKWFVSKNFNALYPKDYFDGTRTLKKEVGFSYTANSWKKHLEYEKEKEIKKSKISKKSDIRKNKINESKKIETKIRLYLKDKLTIDALYNYVENNHPNYSNNIAGMVMKVQSQLIKN